MCLEDAVLVTGARGWLLDSLSLQSTGRDSAVIHLCFPLSSAASGFERNDLDGVRSNSSTVLSVFRTQAHLPSHTSVDRRSFHIRTRHLGLQLHTWMLYKNLAVLSFSLSRSRGIIFVEIPVSRRMRSCSFVSESPIIMH